MTNDQEWLEVLEDLDDPREIERMRHDTTGDRPLEEVLAELGLEVRLGG